MDVLRTNDVIQAVRTNFPDLMIDTFAPLGDGWGNRTFLVNDAVVFRFPKDADAATALIRERRLLAELAPALPLPIPRYRYAGHPTAQYPFVFGDIHSMEVRC